jgi:uracil-DNA glycosylase
VRGESQGRNSFLWKGYPQWTKGKDINMNMKRELEMKLGKANGIYLNDIEIDPFTIKTVMINEVVPSDPLQDFYGASDADYMKTTIPLFQGAGTEVSSIQDILQMGIYITNAVKTPKTEYAIDKSSIENSLPYLEAELSLLPNLKVIMLMGDVAKKAFNMITKKSTKKNAIPAVSTYKLRNSEIYYEGIRIMPSYIMTGGNILIEKSKVTMATEDIATMLEIIK